MASHCSDRVSLPPPRLSSLLSITFMVSQIMGYFPCRSPISIDLLTQPPPAMALGETETSTPDLLSRKRMHRGNTEDDLGCAGEGHPSPRLGVVEGESMTEEPAHLETPAGVVSCPTAAAEAKLA
jgi:hypothetical protein